MKHVIFSAFITTILCLIASPVMAGGGMNCGFGSWEGPDETIRLFPTYAVFDAEAKVVRLPIHVWVHEREEDRLRRAAIKALGAGLGVEDGTPEHDVFRRRMVSFMVDNERGKQVRLYVQGDRVKPIEDRLLGETPANGHIETVVDVPVKGKKAPEKIVVSIQVDGATHSFRTIEVPVVSATGLTVVSDIDDTIKITNVVDKSEMVANTFTREFRPVPGMVKYFDGWVKEGATFHYLSASPWNLQTELQQFTTDHGFPSGVFHLRTLRLKDLENTVEFVKDSRPHKLSALRTLMQHFPKRRFILVGDSGERDPEIYGMVAREFGDQVQQIAIRKVPGADNDPTRFTKAFDKIEPKTWSVVDPQ